MKQLHVPGSQLSFTVLADGGIVTDLVFTGKSKKKYTPLYKNSWLKENLKIDTPLLRYIQGEFLCLPFGGGRKAEYPDWLCDVPAGEFPDLHGHCTAHPWHIEAFESGAKLSILYPEAHPIERITKTVLPSPCGLALDVSYQITARKDAALPFGIHPNIALPSNPRSVRIEPAPYRFAQTIPAETEAGISLLQGNAQYPSLEAAPLKGGGSCSLLSFPLPEKTEEIVQLCGIEGWVNIHFPEYSIKLSWDPQDMPSCILWISNGGRSYSPWNGRNFCLGVEPICGAYDLSLSAALSENPINKQGIPTFRQFYAGETYSFGYSIKFLEER